MDASNNYDNAIETLNGLALSLSRSSRMRIIGINNGEEVVQLQAKGTDELCVNLLRITTWLAGLKEQHKDTP